MALVRKFVRKLKTEGVRVALPAACAYVGSLVPHPVRNPLRFIQATKPLARRHCPNCGYFGFFDSFGSPPRIDACCVKCGALERHRLFKLALDRNILFSDTDREFPVMHFAAEPVLEKVLRKTFRKYLTADLFQRADVRLNIEDIALEDKSCGIVIANHVLEHVDDRKAAREIFRVLRKGGQFVASVPLVEGWAHTYENKAIATKRDRVLHFGQGDHVRYYGRDFRDRIMGAGFRSMTEITAEGDDVTRFGLRRGEKIFVFTK